jgi:hypothetical protein
MRRRHGLDDGKLANPGNSGGASFWLPGIFGSLAAVPGVPGWAYSTLYIHESESAGAQKNFVVSGRPVGAVAAGLNANADVLVQGVTYVSAMPVLGGQAACECGNWIRKIAPPSVWFSANI